MFVTDQELSELRKLLELQPGTDPELHRRCSLLVQKGAYDEAVRTAFILLEERLRVAIGVEGMTGVALANSAFNNNSNLSKLLAQTPSERDGLRELYSGAFKLFRNPSAHGVVGYEAADCKDVLALVNLLLRILDRSKEGAAAVQFPPNLETALAAAEAELGPGAVARLRGFLGKAAGCGMVITKREQWIAFRSYALRKEPDWPTPKRYTVTVFYFVNVPGEYNIYFPTAGALTAVVGFDLEGLKARLAQLGFQPTGSYGELRMFLKNRNDATFFGALWDLVQQVNKELQATLP